MVKETGSQWRGPKLFGSSSSRDMLILLLTAVPATVVTVRLELTERLIGLTESFEHHELDEYLLVVVIWCVAGIIFTIRRSADLKIIVKVREESERQARHLARHDPLTRLGNRAAMIAILEQAVSERDNILRSVILLIDLDRFKPVNDIYGHETGDAVLVEIARRFLALARSVPGASVARLGGDEFGFFLSDAPDGEDVDIASKLITLARMPVMTGSATVVVGASIGIASLASAGSSATEWLRLADSAMYRAKHSGRNVARRYDVAMDAEERLAHKVEAELRLGLDRDEFAPFYQPICSLADGRWIGFECLARWLHPTRGLVEAGDFITVAENADLIDRLSLLLLRRACTDASRWPSDYTLSFNLSPIQLRKEWLPDEILRTLNENGVAAGRLLIEITESGLVADFEVARRVINALRAAGVRFALDDFGTGYSSLSHLRELPFDIIKIDRSFIENVDFEHDRSIVTAIIRMGHTLGMKLISEGISDESSRRTLTALGCDYAQGYFIGRPADAAETLRRIACRARSFDLPQAATA